MERDGIPQDALLSPLALSQQLREQAGAKRAPVGAKEIRRRVLVGELPNLGTQRRPLVRWGDWLTSLQRRAAACTPPPIDPSQPPKADAEAWARDARRRDAEREARRARAG